MIARGRSVQQSMKNPTDAHRPTDRRPGRGRYKFQSDCNNTELNEERAENCQAALLPVNCSIWHTQRSVQWSKMCLNSLEPIEFSLFRWQMQEEFEPHSLSLFSFSSSPFAFSNWGPNLSPSLLSVCMCVCGCGLSWQQWEDGKKGDREEWCH